jgi:hypothetical protein
MNFSIKLLPHAFSSVPKLISFNYADIFIFENLKPMIYALKDSSFIKLLYIIFVDSILSSGLSTPCFHVQTIEKFYEALTGLS